MRDAILIEIWALERHNHLFIYSLIFDLGSNEELDMGI